MDIKEFEHNRYKKYLTVTEDENGVIRAELDAKYTCNSKRVKEYFYDRLRYFCDAVESVEIEMSKLPMYTIEFEDDIHADKH